MSALLAYIYLFIRRIATLTTEGSAHTNAKERDKKEIHGGRDKKSKGIEAQRMKPPTPSRVIDVVIEDKEQKKKKKKEKKKETGSRSPTQLPWTIRSPTIRAIL